MYKDLLSPIKVGELQLKNRIAMAPMGIGSYKEDETITDEYVDFLKARAAGTGLIITTGTRISDKYGRYKVNGCFDKRFIPGLRKITEAVHKKGTKILLQIMALGPADPYEPYVPSLNIEDYRSMVKRKDPAVPKELTLEQIEELIEAFAYSADIAQQSGFDGVELFGSEDGLISSFLCPHYNNRTDDYGGSFENRVRFCIDIIRKIRKQCGERFATGFKFNAIYNIKDGIDLSEGVKIAQRIAEEGAAYIHCWSFDGWEKPMSAFSYPPMPNLYQPRNSLIEISRNLKDKLEGTPVMVVGGILKHSEADEIIRSGFADIVAVGRGYIAEPLWGHNAGDHKHLIRPCIRCHVCHNEVAVKGNIVTCSVNPDVLSRDKITASKERLNILIAGGGPSGVMAAVTASMRGHHVTLYEKDKNIGGKLVAGSQPDFKYEFKDLLSFLEQQLKIYRLKYSTGLMVDEEIIEKERPDVLVLAIGAVPYYPEIEGIASDNVFEATFALNDPSVFKGKNVVVIGGGDVGCETALFLARKGARSVSVIEMLDRLMKEEFRHNSITLESLLYDERINVYTGSRVSRILSNKVEFFKDNETSSILGVDSVILATGFIVPEDNIRALKNTKVKTLLTGDCVKPQRLREAIASGYMLGKSL